MFYNFEGIENARDLRELTRDDGAKMKENVFIRCGELRKATDGDIARLADMGVYAVADFRDITELDRRPDRIIPGAKYVHFQALNLKKVFKKPENDPSLVAAEVKQEFRNIYVHLATAPESHEAYKNLFKLFLEAEGRPVMYHCTQGKDRTGVATMLLLSALGFDEDTILAEYLLTNQYNGRVYEAKKAAGMPEDQLALMHELVFVYYENARNYLNILQTEYGSVLNFLELVLEIGPEEIRKLESYCLV